MQDIMKKAIITLACLFTLILPASADEGMWLLPMIEKMNAGALRDLGCRLTPEQIYSINHSSLKDAIVHFGGGCTGEIISDEGLLVTNHHCGYSSIQNLSSDEHNYLEDGFWALKRNEELPVPGLKVTFLESMTDVTDALKSDDGKRRAEIIKEAQAANPGCRVMITGFYASNINYLIVYKEYKDVRLVGTPPASMGKFGGETDNWMWPRQTCDFSMFRVYAGPNNEPAEYSAENKPLHPRQSLKISLKGYQEGDYAMIMGYPGRTQRYMTASQMEQMLRTNDIAIAARTVRQDIMWRAMRADAHTGLQYASKYASSANGWKKWIGEKKAFAKLDVIAREKAKEADFQKWVNANSKRKAKYGGVIERIDSCVAARGKALESLYLLYETLGRIEVFNLAGSFYAVKGQKDSVEAFKRIKAEIAKEYRDFNHPLDRLITVAMIEHYRKNVDPSEMISIPGWDFATMDAQKFTYYIASTSLFTYLNKYENHLDSMNEVENDTTWPFILAFREKVSSLYEQMADANAKLKDASKLYTAGLMEWKKGEAMYPDANSTMRLTYGTIKAYSPADGVQYNYYTTLKGVMEKENPDDYEFRVPAKLKEIYAKKDYGKYALADGSMPACFLCNCDITGGNSGSPVLDADGNLIGLAFDGNWESMSSDVLFEPELQRCICVDIRYVLLMMDNFGGAGYLLKEMNIVK